MFIFMLNGETPYYNQQKNSLIVRLKLPRNSLD
jgi:hypothetical protein